MNISIVIPSYRGLDLLREFLPSVKSSMDHYDGGSSECLVVDDGGGDDTLLVLSAEFPWVKVLTRQSNGGFSAAVNTGINASSYPWILLLNNDMRVESDFMAPLMAEVRRNPDLFAASSFQQSPSEAINTESGCSHLFFKKGLYRTTDLIHSNSQGDLSLHNFTTGGASLYSKEKLLELGCFCDLFNPYYAEDTEVSLQALKRGWEMAFVRESVVWHIPAMTTKRDGVKKLKRTGHRNYFICHWMTLDKIDYWLEHLFYTAIRLVIRPLRGDVAYLVGFLDALAMLPQVISQRKLRSNGWTRNVHDSLSRFRIRHGSLREGNPGKKNGVTFNH